MEYDICTVGTSDYKNNFFNEVMRGQSNSMELVNRGSIGGNMYAIPYDSYNQQESYLTPFINIFNEFYAKDTSKKIRAVFKAKG